MFPCITPVSAHFWPPLEKGPLGVHVVHITNSWLLILDTVSAMCHWIWAQYHSSHMICLHWHIPSGLWVRVQHHMTSSTYNISCHMTATCSVHQYHMTSCTVQLYHMTSCTVQQCHMTATCSLLQDWVHMQTEVLACTILISIPDEHTVWVELCMYSVNPLDSQPL